MLTITLIDLAQFFGTEIDHFAVPPAMCESAPLLLDCHLSLDFAQAVLFFSWPSRSFVIFMKFELIQPFLL